MGLFSFFKASSPGLSKLEATEYLCRQMRKHWPNGSFEIENPDDSLGIVVQIQVEEHQLSFFPDNFHKTYLQSPDELDSFCAQMIEAIENMFNQAHLEPTLLCP